MLPRATSLEKPLLGAVLCCTAIATEDRTRLAEYAERMGAEHKLDLTSDVTHLLVGSTDTPKYQYVAKEREDVKVLRPEWVEAVRECWMGDRPIDMNALEAEYRVPALAGLKICITGFDDLTFRAQLQRNVASNGGEYTGDLTKDVTHLIVAKPEGKKYEYATLWQKKVVSLQWYKDTLERGMQLDETKYHPTRPVEEQGTGAWNRHDKRQPVTGKRTNDEQLAQEPLRKLRRVTSARLGSQTENMWGDITGQPVQPSATNQSGLRSVQSLPQIRESRDKTNEDKHSGQPKDILSTSGGFFHGLWFTISNFEKRKETLVRQTLQAAGATVLESLSQLLTSQGVEPERMYLIVPHQTRQTELPISEKVIKDIFVVSELWLERCMFQKAWLHPGQYPLGGIITVVDAHAIASFSVNATGFQSIETLHIAKTVALTGAKYVENFTPQTTVLVCNSMNINRQKVLHAKHWGVPAVSESWLCRLLADGVIPSFDNYLIDDEEDGSNDLEDELKQKRQERNRRSPPDIDGNKSTTNGLSFSERPTSNTPTANTETKASEKSQSNKSTDSRQKDSRQRNGQIETQDTALQEISPNSPSQRSRPPSLPPKKSLFRSYDGANSGIECKEESFQRTNDIQKSSSPKRLTHDAASMNSAIEDLLNMKAKAKASRPTQQGEQRDKKKRLLGRALSNLSNASHGSRLSRASSIDSLNTDGVGTEIPPPSARSNNTERTPAGAQQNSVPSQPHSKNSSTTVATDSMYQTAPINHTDPYLLLENIEHEEAAPPMTQLGYEDSEEAIALREKLAAKRRARNKSDNVGITPESEIDLREKEALKQKEKQKQVIKDDETLTATGWGAGRRTRAKNRSRETNDLEIF